MTTDIWKSLPIAFDLRSVWQFREKWYCSSDFQWPWRLKVNMWYFSKSLKIFHSYLKLELSSAILWLSIAKIKVIFVCKLHMLIMQFLDSTNDYCTVRFTIKARFLRALFLRARFLRARFLRARFLRARFLSFTSLNEPIFSKRVIHHSLTMKQRSWI